MQRALFHSAAAALIALALHTAPLHAQAKQSVCKDGTTSTAVGKGACSSHGGVDAKATETARKAAAKVAKAEKKAAKAEEKAETKAEKKAEKAAEQVTCTDGTMSKGGRGACSSHGGIRKTEAKKP